MKQFIVIDWIMEGTKFDGYYSNWRYINTDTFWQSYPEENVVLNSFFTDENFWIKVSDYIEYNQKTIDWINNRTIKVKDIYWIGKISKALEILNRRKNELLVAYKKYWNESIAKIGYLYKDYLSYI